MKLFLVLALGCAPTARLAKTCPVTWHYAVDFAATATGLALSALAYNEGREGAALLWATAGMGVAVADSLSECRR